MQLIMSNSLYQIEEVKFDIGQLMKTTFVVPFFISDYYTKLQNGTISGYNNVYLVNKEQKSALKISLSKLIFQDEFTVIHYTTDNNVKTRLQSILNIVSNVDIVLSNDIETVQMVTDQRNNYDYQFETFIVLNEDKDTINKVTFTANNLDYDNFQISDQVQNIDTYVGNTQFSFDTNIINYNTYEQNGYIGDCFKYFYIMCISDKDKQGYNNHIIVDADFEVNSQ